MAYMVFEVKGVGLVSGTDVFPEYWHIVEQLEKGKKWVCSVSWDFTKASKPSGITPPFLFDFEDDEDNVYFHFKGLGYFGTYYMVCDTEDEAKESFKKLVAWVYDKRADILGQSGDEFKKVREEFLKRQFKKVK